MNYFPYLIILAVGTILLSVIWEAFCQRHDYDDCPDHEDTSKTGDHK